MWDLNYTERTQLVLLAIFAHYLGYFFILVLDSLEYPKRIRVSYGIKNVFKRKVASDSEPVPSHALEETQHFREHNVRYTKLIKSHYLNNSFFFFVGCLCAIFAGTKTQCTLLILSLIHI
eukprot:TRINITY_DN2531_c0_g1_i4.p3 TRINITY_DN2531_c0_g1~~TRINITY_DN2531_c0_g1_i4.p3  ORF type:complete len:120 (-),score=5.78 TRINITY_DN2531_c0_g1_i4:148-507(-)